MAASGTLGQDDAAFKVLIVTYASSPTRQFKRLIKWHKSLHEST